MPTFDGATIGILGYGQTGRALAQFYTRPKIRDRARDDGLAGIDILHVCIPYSGQFTKIVKGIIAQIRPTLTIIHATVAPGTTQAIGGMVVHSPIMGAHPYLYQSMKTFVKFIGADDPKPGRMAKRHLEQLGIQTKLVYPSRSTELGKLLDTSYYGLCIAWHGEMKRMCDRLGVDFTDVVTQCTESYNEGYTMLGMNRYIRPILTPPKRYIGGTCIIPNARILRRVLTSAYLDLILEYSRGKNRT